MNDMTVHMVSADIAVIRRNFRNRLSRPLRPPSRPYAQKPQRYASAPGGTENTLGNHVQQSGSRVGPQTLRFDFTHHKAMTPGEIRAVEQTVK